MDDGLIRDKRKRDEVRQAVLAGTILAVESRYPTTIAEDELLLQQTHLGKRRRMAIQVRIGEKRLLEEGQDIPVNPVGGRWSGSAQEGEMCQMTCPRT